MKLKILYEYWLYSLVYESSMWNNHIRSYVDKEDAKLVKDRLSIFFKQIHKFNIPLIKELFEIKTMNQKDMQFEIIYEYGMYSLMYQDKKYWLIHIKSNASINYLENIKEQLEDIFNKLNNNWIIIPDELFEMKLNIHWNQKK